MCGIVGFSSHPLATNVCPARTRELLSAMAQRIVHRGPDDHALHVLDNGSAGVAHRRLSIVDLTQHGRQPFLNEDATLALVCNGEIYNHLELRQQLQARGHRFTSHSDNEVILHLYEEIGAKVVDRLKGMFAFTILDTRTGDLFCARDPLGKKPIYYGQSPQGVAVASEIPALFEVPGLDLRLDGQAVGLFLLRNLRHVPDPWTIYQGIRTVPPGHTLRVTNGRAEPPVRYWYPRLQPQSTSPEDVLDSFDRAVSRRRVCDVEIGALLSGGVDSTAIVDSLGRMGSTNMRSYAFGFDRNDEELVRARTAAKHLGTRHKEVYFDAARQHDLFEDLFKQHGQPIMALPLTHAMMLFEAIHGDGLKVVMSGHGADEVFYGYDGAENLARLSRLDQALPTRLTRPLARALCSRFPSGRLGEALRIFAHPPGQRKTALYRHEADVLWPGLFQTPPDLKTISAWSEPWFKGGFEAAAKPPGYIDEAAFLGLMQENAHAITIAGDLPAMAYGIEVRCPFMDRDLVEQALCIPYRDKVRHHRGFSPGKTILKQALESRLPAEILRAPKRGFGYFVQEEKVLRGPWKARLDAAFSAPDDLGGMLNADALRTFKARFDQGAPDAPAILMAKLYALQRFQAIRGAT